MNPYRLVSVEFDKILQIGKEWKIFTDSPRWMKTILVEHDWAMFVA